jgi:hypothetical protein
MLAQNLNPAPAKSIVSLVAQAASAAGATSATAEPRPKPHFLPPAEVPTQAGPNGLRFDFNFGGRVFVPETGEPWRIRLLDLDTGNVLYETSTRRGGVSGAKHYYLRMRIEVMCGERMVFAHDYDCRDKEVPTQFPVGTLGDILGWFPYAPKFQRARLPSQRGDGGVADSAVPRRQSGDRLPHT